MPCAGALAISLVLKFSLKVFLYQLEGQVEAIYSLEMKDLVLSSVLGFFLYTDTYKVSFFVNMDKNSNLLNQISDQNTKNQKTKIWDEQNICCDPKNTKTNFSVKFTVVIR